MARRIFINIPMAEAIKKQLQMEFCPVCGKEITEHKWIEIKGLGSMAEISRCSEKS